MQEAVTFAFMESKTAALFGETPEALRLENPIAEDLDQMRPTPVASLLLAAGRNAARGFADVALCEIGRDIPNTCLVGALAASTGWLRLDSVLTAMGEYLSGSMLEKNIRNATRGYHEVEVRQWQ